MVHGRKPYEVPLLIKHGSIENITGTDCVDLNGDGDGKTFGAPSDWTFNIWGLSFPSPTTDCTVS